MGGGVEVAGWSLLLFSLSLPLPVHPPHLRRCNCTMAATARASTIWARLDADRAVARPRGGAAGAGGMMRLDGRRRAFFPFWRELLAHTQAVPSPTRTWIWRKLAVLDGQKLGQGGAARVRAKERIRALQSRRLRMRVSEGEREREGTSARHRIRWPLACSSLAALVCMASARRRRLNQQAAAGLTSTLDRRGNVDYFSSPPPPSARPTHPRPAGPALNPAIPLVLTVAACLGIAWLVLSAQPDGLGGAGLRR